MQDSNLDPTRHSETNENVISEKIWRKSWNFRGRKSFNRKNMRFLFSDRVQCAALPNFAPALFSLPNFGWSKVRLTDEAIFRRKIFEKFEKSKFTKNRKIF